MRMFRLAYFNIKKHISESISLIILITICMMLMCSSLTNLINIQNMFARVNKELDGIENHLIISEKDYYPEYDEVLENNENVTRFEHIDCVKSFSTSFLDDNGEEASQYMCFVNQENEEKIEYFRPETTMTAEEIASTEHPIYVPFYVKDTLHKNIGDTFNIIYNGNIYPFTIVGFAESCIYSDNTMFLKIIVSDDDFRILQKTMGKSYILGFNAKDGTSKKVINDFDDYVVENTHNGEELNIQRVLYDSIETSSGGYLKSIFIVMMCMSLVVLLAVVIMIKQQIKNDISDQVVSIGVLEALGYKSGEISISYVIEYVFLGIVGILLGLLGSFALNPSLYHVGELMTGHHIKMEKYPLLNTAIGLFLLFFVLILSFLSSRMVKKYPPIMAFRKGILDHHFGKNYLSLDKTRTNVHLRLAMKGAVSNTKQNIGVAICVLVATLAAVFCYGLYTYCDDGMNAIKSLTGIEISNIRIGISNDTDADLMIEELLQNPEVTKINKTNDWFDMAVLYNNSGLTPIVYEDYANTSQIEPHIGRLPKHDNEIVITQIMASTEMLDVGDVIKISYGRIEKQYMICGIVSSVTNGGANVYFTENGIKRIKPSYKADVLEISLAEGTNRKEFINWITHTYGKSMQDALSDKVEANNEEERIRAEAEKQIATLLTTYGLSHVEYAVMVDGKIISGTSSIFKVTSVVSLEDILVTQLSSAVSAFSAGAKIFMIISIVVVMIIMFMIMESSVKKQWEELGIFKGLGYTSNELMLQLSFKIVPILIIGIILGSILAIICLNMLTVLLGKVIINYVGIIAVDFILLAFSYGAAFIGARKIRKISVYELMTE